NWIVPAARGPSVIYLPPAMSPNARYPVLYLLQGFHGGPHQYFAGLDFARFADRAIASHRVAPFIAVAAPAGITFHYDGEWAGAWEGDFVRDVVPWGDRNLPTRPVRTARVLAGLSAGGYGAVDIGLRHPSMFGTLESWSGYFEAPHDGPLARADGKALAAHDPSLLVRREATELRALGVRFFLS